MSIRWWIREGAGLVDDDGHAAVPADALHAAESVAGAESWVELPATRWGQRHRELDARANFEHLEKLYPCVQRVLAVREQWRCLIVRDVDLWRLDDVIGVLEAGENTSQAAVTALLRRLLRQRVDQVEAAEVIEDLPALLREVGAPTAARTVAGAMDEEAVVRAYLTIAADTSPLPVVDALGARFPAHEVVVERLVQAVSERPELVTAGVSLGGAPSWQTYERWLLG
ncbi:hypothetical protein CIK66_10565 [Brachybacterium alimentarium]|uniref:Uncharacterized protein n=1 Tax=Brachybacterium alimentarium TaxID=47845 RepID=A0A2A3YIK8_9MICO|nr:hypothetical protein [Brachybacterium alimentarium]PCC39121.1 hypothetical protein CIK66_10565 [Brachybacterium alimentarium]